MKKVSNILVSDIMRKAKYKLPKTMRVWKAWRVMKAQSEFYLPVEDNGDTCGVVGFRELQLASNLSGNERTEVFEVMDMHILRVSASEAALSVIQKMFNENINCALVEDGGNVVGIVNSFDAMKLLLDESGRFANTATQVQNIKAH